MKEFKDMKEMFTRVVKLQDDIKNSLANYIEKENIGVKNYAEKLSDKYNEIADYIFDELSQEESGGIMYLSDNMENLDGDAQIITAFVKAYITEQIIIETVSLEELEERHYDKEPSEKHWRDTRWKIKTETTTLNPIDMIPKLFKFKGMPEGMERYTLGHIKHNPEINENYDFRIIRESTHDGTILFSIELMTDVLEPVVFRSAYCKKHYSPEEFAKKVKETNYEIGDLTVEINFGAKEINGVSMTGQTETIYLPVKCEYILESEEAVN